MDGTNITRQREGRIESYVVGTKITLQVDGWHKNSSPKGWTDGESDGWARKKLAKGWRIKMVNSKITRQMDGPMES